MSISANSTASSTSPPPVSPPPGETHVTEAEIAAVPSLYDGRDTPSSLSPPTAPVLDSDEHDQSTDDVVIVQYPPDKPRVRLGSELDAEASTIGTDDSSSPQDRAMRALTSAVANLEARLLMPNTTADERKTITLELACAQRALGECLMVQVKSENVQRLSATSAETPPAPARTFATVVALAPQPPSQHCVIGRRDNKTGLYGDNEEVVRELLDVFMGHPHWEAAFNLYSPEHRNRFRSLRNELEMMLTPELRSVVKISSEWRNATSPAALSSKILSVMQLHPRNCATRSLLILQDILKSGQGTAILNRYVDFVDNELHISGQPANDLVVLLTLSRLSESDRESFSRDTSTRRIQNNKKTSESDATIYDLVQPNIPFTIEELRRYLQRRDTRLQPFGTLTGTSPSTRADPPPTSTERSKGERGSKPHSSNKTHIRECFTCGRRGHISTHCPDRSQKSSRSTDDSKGKKPSDQPFRA